MKIIELHKSVTESNDRDAEKLRNELKERGTFLINVMSSPGAGKTTLLSRIITDLKNELRIAVMEADIDASVDAEKIEALGARSIQLHTDGMCHMDAGMTRQGIEAMGIEEIDLAFLRTVEKSRVSLEKAYEARRIIRDGELRNLHILAAV